MALWTARSAAASKPAQVSTAVPQPAVTDSGPGTPSLRCEGVRVTLDGVAGAVDVLADLNFAIAAGSFVSVLGTSGAGKTTLLRTLGGLQPASAGTVSCNGVPISGPPVGAVTVFQDYQNSLLPWRTVAHNVALGIERRLPREERERRVADALDAVDLGASATNYPWRLSGGMQQRVQIARALAVRPSILLMDEPFGALDAMTKASLQDQLLAVHHDRRATIVFVTHDVDEAVYLSDRLLVLDGRPANIALDLADPLPRPRDQLTTKESPDYLALRREVFTAIRSGARS